MARILNKMIGWNAFKAQKLKEANNHSNVVIDQAAAERQNREIEYLKRQLTEVQVENDQLKESEEVQSKRHKKDQDLIGDRVDQLERENEMAQKEKEIIGTGWYYQLDSENFHWKFMSFILEGWRYTIIEN